MNDQDATLEEGVSESKTKREQELEAIRARKRGSEAGEVAGGDAPPADPSAEEPGAQPPEGGEIPSGDGDAPPAPNMLKFYGDDGTEYEIPETAKARLKVDGKEIEEPLTKVTTRYQKGAAGDLRLQEANRVKQELEAKERELAKRGQELTAKEQDYIKRVDAANRQKSSLPGLSEDGKKVRKELISALIDADEERAEKAFSKLGTPTQQPAQAQVDPKTIDARVDQMVEAKWQKREQERAKKDRETAVKSAVKWLYEERSDLAEDPHLMTAVDRETAAIMKEDPKKSPLEVMQEAANRVQKWIDGKTQKPARSAKKKATPTPASGRRSMGEDPPPPPTRKERINAIRRRRGQAPL